MTTAPLANDELWVHSGAWTMSLDSHTLGWAETGSPKRCKPPDPYRVASAHIAASTPAANHPHRDWRVIGIRAIAARDKDKGMTSALGKRLSDP